MMQVVSRNITVGMADMKLTKDPSAVIVTHALGSCLGIAIYDPVAKVGGLLHLMLPSSKTDPDKAKQKPLMFVDTAVPRLFRESYALGAEKSRLQVTVAGGASRQRQQDSFKIGARNFAALRRLLFKNRILIRAQEVGGHAPRTMRLDMATGDVTIQTGSERHSL